MAKEGTAVAQSSTEAARPTAATPRCLAIAEAGVKTGADFANLMSALMSDIIAGRIDARSANATCSAGGKLLKIVEMQMKYGKPGGQEEKVLNLVS